MRNKERLAYKDMRAMEQEDHPEELHKVISFFVRLLYYNAVLRSDLKNELL